MRVFLSLFLFITTVTPEPTQLPPSLSPILTLSFLRVQWPTSTVGLQSCVTVRNFKVTPFYSVFSAVGALAESRQCFKMRWFRRILLVMNSVLCNFETLELNGVLLYSVIVVSK